MTDNQRLNTASTASRRKWASGQAERFVIKHLCHWPNCDAEVPPKMWGCKRHWFMLPKRLRDRIWATYKPGQEITKTPSRLYIMVAQEAQEWILGRDFPQPRKASKP